MQSLRSFLFNLVMWVSVLLFVPFALLTFPFPLSVRYQFISQWARFQMFMLKHLCRLDYRIDGLNHLPPGPAIILSKHQSAWETIAFQQIFPQQTWVLKRELIWVPVFGWGLALLKPIAIDRGSGRKAIEQVIEQGRDRLQNGTWVVVFPEGTRVAPGHKRRYGIGGAVLAAETGYPVVPVAHNAGSFWPRRGFHKRSGTVGVVIGPTIDSRGKTAEEIKQQAEAWIERTTQSLEKKTV